MYKVVFNRDSVWLRRREDHIGLSSLQTSSFLCDSYDQNFHIIMEFSTSKCWHNNSAAVFSLTWSSQDKLWWAGYHQYEDRTRDSSLFCQALCASCLGLDSMVHWFGSKKWNVRVRLCAVFAFLRLPVWLLDSGDTALFLLISCSQPGDPPSPGAAVQELSRAWLGALPVRARAQRQEPTACSATRASVSAYDFWPLLRAQNWSNQGSGQAEPQLCPAELLVVTKLAQIPPVQNLGCYSS